MCLTPREVDGRCSLLRVEGELGPKLCFIKFRDERRALTRRQSNNVISAELELFLAFSLCEHKLLSFSCPSFSH